MKKSYTYLNWCFVFLTLFFLNTTFNTTAFAQNATLTGQVIDRQTGESLPAANVIIEELQRGTATDMDGEYTIENIEPGTYTVIANFIGYRASEQTVELSADEVLQLDFELQSDMIGLDQVVVTGQAGMTRQREIGSSVGRIQAENLIGSTSNVESMIQGQVAGVNIMQTAGSSGAGGQIRIRGNVSVSMSNQPLIYIDGIRLRSEPYPNNVPPVGFAGRGANVQSTPINDIIPADIENVEIIKGAAATTLYGSEAAAGVIQIFTKMGSNIDRPIWHAEVEQGANFMRPFGTDEVPYIFLDPWLRTGHSQRYSMSVRGGDDRVQYYVSGNFSDSEGVLPNDTEDKYALRANFRSQLAENLYLRVNSAYTRHAIINTASGNNAQGLTLNAYRQDQNYIGSSRIEDIDQFLDYDIQTNNNRFMVGGTLNYQQASNLDHDFTVGYDYADSDLFQQRPVGFPGATQGIRSNQRWNYTTLTLDYTGTYNWRINPDLRFNFAWGGETVQTREASVTGHAEEFPGPGEPTLTSGARTLSFEDRIRIITGGFFGQSVIDFKDRYFLTLGLRVDGNSAFGEDLGLQPYPKVSFSYVLSDESFWDNSLGTLRLRAAYGHAGRAPGAFDAVRTWSPVGWGERVAYRAANVGNPDLGPERTKETEFGIDLSTFNDRLNIDFTYYYQNTTDALFNVRQIPSQGFLSSQLENIGELENQGIELTINGKIVERSNFGWNVGLNLATNQSKVLDLGEAANFSLDGNHGWIVEGQPVPVIRGDRITNPNEIGEPNLEENYHYGPNEPTHIIGISTSFDLPYGITLSARGEYQGGHYIYDGASLNTLARGVQFPTCFDAFDLINAGQSDQLTALDRSRCIPTNVRSDWFIYPADFFKLRELSLRIPLPIDLGPHGSSTFTVTGRNLWTWKNSEFPIFDPEITWRGAGDATRQIFEHIPPAASLTGTLRVTF
ncbi:TonB-dependent receptor [Rhodohalobacter sp. SW132]|nr:TonB-dependent receptor [Rhodohalobacter sp. SW132]